MSKSSKKNIFQELGMSLAMVGVPYGMYLNWFAPESFRWSPMIMILAVLLSFNYRNLILLRFPAWNKMFRVIICFQIVMLLYGCIDYRGGMSVQYLLFHFFIIFFTMGLATNDLLCDWNRFLKVLYLVSLPLLFCGVFVVYMDLITEETIYTMMQTEEMLVIEPFTVASGVLSHYFAVLTIKKENLLHYLLFVVSTIGAVYVILWCGKRTPVFVMIMGTVLYLYATEKISLKNSKRMFLYCGAICFVAIVAYFNIFVFQEKFDVFWHNFVNGIANLFGDTSVSDDTGSAIARVHHRNLAEEIITLKFDTVNYIFGYGYMTAWLDAPILQSYLDMGIIGFIFYFYIIVFIPYKIWRMKIFKPEVMFSLLCSLYAILSIINSGTPYMYIKYTGVVLLSFFTTCYMYKESIRQE